MNEIRRRRVAEAMREEASAILRQLKDPRLGFTSITRVDVSRDLRHAKVFVSVLGGEEERQATMAALERARGYVRSELGRRIRLRFTPEIQFVLDRSIEYGDRIGRLLRQLHPSAGTEPPADPAQGEPGADGRA